MAKKILIGAHNTVLGGAAYVLLDMVRALQPEFEVQVSVPRPDGPLPGALSRLGVRTHVVATQAWLPFPRTPLDGDAVGALQRILGDEGIDLTLSNTAVVGSLAMAAARTGTPHLWYLHEALATDVSLYPAMGPSRCCSIIDSLSSKVLACSQNVLQEFLAHAGTGGAASDAGRHEVLYPALRDRFVPADAEQQQPSGRFTAICCGVQSFRKGVDRLVRAAAMIRRDIPGFRLLLVGDPGDASALVASLVDQFQLHDTVQLMPHSEQSEQLIRAAHLAVYPAVREPFGLSLLEAAANGLPVLTTRCGGSEEILADFPAACWLESGDPREIHQRVLDVHRRHAQALDQARQAAPQLVERFAFERFADRLRSLAGEACGLPPGREPATAFRLMLDPDIPDDPLAIGSEIADITGLDPEQVRHRLEAEMREPGTSVNEDARAFGITPHRYDDRMAALYREGYGFIFELMAHHRDEERKRMSQFILREIYQHCFGNGKGFEDCSVLVIGDGIGSDSLNLAAAGLNVVYFDVPGSRTFDFATGRFARRGALAERISIVTELGKVGQPVDFVVCLEVLEHVESPEELLDRVSDMLDPGGLAFLSDCFGGVIPKFPTHLECNGKYAGLLPFMALGRSLELQRYNPQPFGKPWVFRKCEPGQASIDAICGDGNAMQFILAHAASVRGMRLQKTQ